MAKLWGRISVWLLRVVCGTGVEFRGLEKLPKGSLIVAAKHQSTWETFALLRLFDDPTFIVKRELMWIPIFGWCMWKGGMVPVDRGAGAQALTDMVGARQGRGRQRPPTRHLSGGYAARAGCRAALQVRRRASLRRARRALRADRAQLRPVLEPSSLSPVARHDRRRGARSDCAGSGQAGVLRPPAEQRSRAATARLVAEGRARVAKSWGVRRSRQTGAGRLIGLRRAQAGGSAAGSRDPSAARRAGGVRGRGCRAPRARPPSRSRSRGCCRTGHGPAGPDEAAGRARAGRRIARGRDRPRSTPRRRVVPACRPARPPARFRDRPRSPVRARADKPSVSGRWRAATR